jgi:hypothetical protein
VFPCIVGPWGADMAQPQFQSFATFSDCLSSNYAVLSIMIPGST